MTRTRWAQIGALGLLGAAIVWAYAHRAGLGLTTLERAVHGAGLWGRLRSWFAIGRPAPLTTGVSQ